ncbi:MAG: hypothetical protein CVT98_08315 [Bacteroidetes bacterium HGW-Bacteroidetes-15]|nr:MAG: hypothetical protein CVT98_08315 [Bacteroidetes bacterium HGW-Bacteroidetes-15]
MRKKTLWLFIAILAIGLITAISVWQFVFKKSDVSVASRAVQVEISVSELVSRFESNEEMANNDFLDKVILVVGKVESVNADSLGASVYLKDPDEMAGVLCNFSSGIVDINTISKGETLKVKGLCSGYLMDVVLNKCSVVD